MLSPSMTALLMLAAISTQAASSEPPSGAAGVAEDGIDLVPGQTVAVRLSANGRIEPAPAPVEGKDSRYSGDTLQFTFGPALTGQGVTLVVRNGYGQTLTYDAEMYFASGQHGHTSTCPVLAHITSYESWSDPLVRLHLSGMKVGGVKRMVCR